MKTYAAYYENDIRIESSSGGMFSLIASKFDIVYGVAMTDDCYGAEFIRVENDITPLRGSKYIQAKVGDTFKHVKKDLEEGRNVLFSGTGCQVNGLSMFLGQEYQNLFLLDVVCHGVPSPKLWVEYVKFQEKKHGKLIDVNFRCKENGWKDFGMKENQVFLSRKRDSFMKMFLRNYCLRPACYNCHAKHFKKSDISLADFWGIEKIAPEMNDLLGTSLVITRTDKGQRLFDSISEELKCKEVLYEEGVRFNSAEHSSVVRPSQRETFFSDLNNLSFREMEKKYVDGPLWKRLARKAKNIVKKFTNGGVSVKQRSNADYGLLFTFKSKELKQ